MGWRDPAGLRTLPGQPPWVLGQLATSRGSGGQPGGHGRPAAVVVEPVGGTIPRLGLARGVLVLGGGGTDRLLDPHQRRRCPDLQGGPGSPGADQTATTGGGGSPAPSLACGAGGDRRAVCREHPLLHGGDLLHHVPQAGGAQGHLGNPVPDVRRPPAAFLPDPADGLPVGYRRTQTGVPDRGGAHCVLGLHRFPADGHRQQLADHGGDYPGPGHRVDDLCTLFGADGRDVPDPCALHRPVAVLPGRTDLRRLPGTADRHHPAQQVPQLDTDRLVPGWRLADLYRGRRPDSGNPWQVLAPGGCRVRGTDRCLDPNATTPRRADSLA